MARRRRKSSGMGLVLVQLALVFGILFIGPFACGAMVDESGAVRAAEDVGWTEVEVIDKAVFWIEIRGCSQSDDARFTVRGINPAGELREALVCDGVFKGGTFRSK